MAPAVTPYSTSSSRLSPSLLPLLLLLLPLLQLAPVLMVHGIESKCGACLIMASQLATRLAKERPRNHLDLRNRLNSKGEREGKVIDYKVSELRAVELLDDLCQGVEKYSLVTKDGKRTWNRNNEGAKTNDRLKLIAEEQGKELKRWCFNVLAEQEEELEDRLKSGDLNVESNVDELLCTKLTSNCKASNLPIVKERTFGDGAKSAFTNSSKDAQEGKGTGSSDTTAKETTEVNSEL